MAEIVSYSSVGAMPKAEALIEFIHFYFHGQTVKLERTITEAYGVFVPSGADCDAEYRDRVCILKSLLLSTNLMTGNAHVLVHAVCILKCINILSHNLLLVGQ